MDRLLQSNTLHAGMVIDVLINSDVISSALSIGEIKEIDILFIIHTCTFAAG